jgi:hypothetical protein
MGTKALNKHLYLELTEEAEAIALAMGGEEAISTRLMVAQVQSEIVEKRAIDPRTLDPTFKGNIKVVCRRLATRYVKNQIRVLGLRQTNSNIRNATSAATTRAEPAGIFRQWEVLDGKFVRYVTPEDEPSPKVTPIKPVSPQARLFFGVLLDEQR